MQPETQGPHAQRKPACIVDAHQQACALLSAKISTAALFPLNGDAEALRERASDTSPI
jgi:hypothetical protein